MADDKTPGAKKADNKIQGTANKPEPTQDNDEAGVQDATNKATKAAQEFVRRVGRK
jgi:hypothetical protein